MLYVPPGAELGCDFESVNLWAVDVSRMKYTIHPHDETLQLMCGYYNQWSRIKRPIWGDILVFKHIHQG